MRHTFSEEHSVQGRTRNRKLSEQGEGREEKGRRDEKWWYSFSSSSPKLWTRRHTMNPRLYLRGTLYDQAPNTAARGRIQCATVRKWCLQTAIFAVDCKWEFAPFFAPTTSSHRVSRTSRSLSFPKFSIPNFEFSGISLQCLRSENPLGGPIVKWWA